VSRAPGRGLRIKLIEIDRPELYVRVEDVDLDTNHGRRCADGCVVHRLYARSVEVRTFSPPAPAATIPVSFKPRAPGDLSRTGRIGTLRLGAISKEEKESQDAAAKRALRREIARARTFVHARHPRARRGRRQGVARGRGRRRERIRHRWRIFRPHRQRESVPRSTCKAEYAGKLQERDVSADGGGSRERSEEVHGRRRGDRVGTRANGARRDRALRDAAGQSRST
jgi:hypothetical protein